MRTIKISILLVALTALIYLGSPSPVKAAGFYEMPPAVVFVQDGTGSMLLKHNFVFDDGMLNNNYSADVDEGFSVPVQ